MVRASVKPARCKPRGRRVFETPVVGPSAAYSVVERDIDALRPGEFPRLTESCFGQPSDDDAAVPPEHGTRIPPTAGAADLCGAAWLPQDARRFNRPRTSRWIRSARDFVTPSRSPISRN